MNTVRRSVRRQGRLALLVSVALAGASLLPVAQAGIIGAEAVAAEAVRADSPHGRLLAVLDRAEVVQAMTARGVDPAQARVRVAALSDDQALALAAELDTAPAGASIVETVVFIFLVLLVTDILGFTKVYPFTRAIR
jgi:hypothetical protein